jgi:tetratricopeptide (TPR) repeat protein
MRRTETCFLSAVLALLAALGHNTPLGGQAGAGTIKGTVKDTSGAPLAGATVTLRNEATARSRAAVSKPDGSYIFSSLEAGSYAVEAVLQGFEKGRRAHISPRTQPEVVDLALPRSRPLKPKADDFEQSFGRASYYDEPQFKPGELRDPAAGGGYSDSAAMTRSELVRDYLEAPDLGATRADSSKTAQADWTEAGVYSSGSELLAHQAFGPASEVFARGVARYPSSARLELGLGTALYAHGQYGRAVGALLAAADLTPSDSRPYIFLAKAFNASGALPGSQAQEVVKRLERFTELEPRNPRAHYYYALALRKARRGRNADLHNAGLDEVETHLRAAAKLDPGFAEARLELGSLYADRGKYADAIPEYQEAIRLRPDLAAPHYRLAQAYARTGQKSRAQEEFSVYERLPK